jgi:predicted SprT family Zn-dependent metalloprotease
MSLAPDYELLSEAFAIYTDVNQTWFKGHLPPIQIDFRKKRTSLGAQTKEPERFLLCLSTKQMLRTAGLFRYQMKRQGSRISYHPLAIILSGPLFSNPVYRQQELVSTLKHEMLHCAQAIGYLEGQPVKPCHNAEFKWWADHIGTTVRHTMTAEQPWTYRCTECAQIFCRSRRISARYVCGRCRGALECVKSV